MKVVVELRRLESGQSTENVAHLFIKSIEKIHDEKLFPKVEAVEVTSE
jgi:hypothetical protein